MAQYASVTYVAGGFNEVEAQLNDNVILCTKDLGYSVRDPSIVKVSRAQKPCIRVMPYPLITSKLTLFMSTFWLNSGGNLVALKSFWSTVAAMVVALSVE